MFFTLTCDVCSLPSLWFVWVYGGDNLMPIFIGRPYLYLEVIFLGVDCVILGIFFLYFIVLSLWGGLILSSGIGACSFLFFFCLSWYVLSNWMAICEKVFMRFCVLLVRISRSNIVFMVLVSMDHCMPVILVELVMVWGGHIFVIFPLVAAWGNLSLQYVYS